MLSFVVWVILIVVIFVSISDKKTSSNAKISRFLKGLALFGTIIVLIVMIFPVITHLIDFDSLKSVDPADGFTIDKYTVKLDVNEKNSIEVEEDITINFYEEGHHGIYKFTPEWLRYTSKDGKMVRRKSILSNYRAEAPEGTSHNIETYNYTLDVVKDKPRIKIGSSFTTLSTGPKDYIIKYTYDQGSDPFVGYDEFIFHAYGDFWGTEINNASIEVTMPKSIEGNTVHFFMDKKRKYDVTEFVNYTIEGNKLVASFDQEKYVMNRDSKYPERLYKSLTVDIELPENYFINGSKNYEESAIGCIIISLFFLLIVFILWVIFGKDYHKGIKVVNYLPPRELSSAELGYISANNYSSKLVTSLIVELAAKKMITIKDKDGKIYIKGTKPDSKDKDYQKKLKAYNKKVSELNEYEQLVLEELITTSSEFSLKEHTTFYTVFSKVENKLDKEYKWVINSKVGFILKYVGFFITILSAIFMLIAYSEIEDLAPNHYFLYYVGFAAVFLTFFLSLIMTRKTKYGEELTAEVAGFKEFLDKVEKNKLETLVEEMPDYFYKILPYTYVFNLSKKWISKFEDIKMPEMKNIDISMSSFDSMNSQIYTPSASVGSSGGGCSSCGGGCSSCGGGCSSCGGGGSW